jgi:O-methyltransferase
MSDADRLTREVRDLKARLAAIEASRWWRLHPRFALRRLRARNESHAQTDQETHAFPFDFDEADKELYRRVDPYTMTTPPRVYALVRAMEYVVARGVPGAIVECGVWRGGSMMAAALTLLRLGVTDRELYLYDTFAGMPPPSEADTTRSGVRAADLLAEHAGEEDSHIWAIASLSDVCAAVLSTRYPEQRIHLVEGLVEDTLPAEAPEEIALLRLDTDWYRSTKHELEQLYPRLAPGGVLIIDDYGHWQGARRAVDEYFGENRITLLLNRVDGTARIGVKPG